MEQHQQSTCNHAGHTRSSGVWWTKISLRLLSILLSVTTIGISAFYATNWTIGALIMLGPPVSLLADKISPISAGAYFLTDWCGNTMGPDRSLIPHYTY
jgi:hypothetical protein